MSEGDDEQLSRGRILVLDDEPGIREVLKTSLETIGFEIDDVTDGAEAVKVYVDALGSSCPFNLTIMDLTIPGEKEVKIRTGRDPAEKR